MKKTQFGASLLAFCLTLSSCQALNLPLENTDAVAQTETEKAAAATSEAKSSTPSPELSYSQDFAKLYEAFTKTSYRGIEAGPLVLGISTPIPQADLEIPAADTETEGGSEAETEPNPQAVAEAAQAQAVQERMALTRRLIQAQIKATETMIVDLESLTPPESLAADHQRLLDYFVLNQEMSKNVLAEADKIGDEILIAPQPPDPFLAEYGDKLKQLEVLGPQAADYMQSLQLRVYADDRLAHVQGEPLSESSYKAQIKTLFPQVISVSPTSLFVITYPSLVNADDSAADAQAQMDLGDEQQAIVDRFETIAAMHPPENCAEIHTAIYAMARLQKDMMLKMLDLLPTLETSASSAALLLELFSKEDLLYLMFSLGPFAAKVPEIVEKLDLNTGAAPEAAPPPSQPSGLEDLTIASYALSLTRRKALSISVPSNP